MEIRVSGKQKCVGLFTDEIKAAHAYGAHAIANDVDTKRENNKVL